MKAAKDFKCTTVLTQEACDHIKEVAEKFGIEFAEVVKVIKQIVAKGITSLKEIIEELKKHFFPGTAMELGITCETVLAKDVCEKLRKVAQDLKIKVEMIDQIIRQLVEEKITDAKRIIALVKAKLADLAKNFKCSWVLNEKVCAKIYEILAEIKVKAQVVDEFIKKLVVKGVKTLQKIIEEIKKHFFPGMKGELLIESELAIKITCEDILSEKACKTLKEAAEKLKVKAAEVDRIVREAVKKGIKKASAIIKLVRAKIVELATNFKCEDALSAKICKKLKDIAELLKIEFPKVIAKMKDIIARGKTTAKAIIEAIKKFFFPGMEIENEIECEEVLAEKVCKSLRDAAKAFKLKVEIIDQLVKEALEHGHKTAAAIIGHIRRHLIEAAKNFHCSNLLPEDVCAHIEEVAKHVGVKMAEVEKVMKEIIAKGITKWHEIIEELKKHFFPSMQGELAVAIVCEDVLSEKVCKTLKDAAKKLKVKAAEVDRIVREAVKKGITKASAIIKEVQAKIIELATDFKCEDALSKKVCDKIHAIADLLKIKYEDIVAKMKKIIAEGKTTAKAIFEAIKKFFFPDHALMIENAITCEDVLSAQVCKSLRDAAKKFGEKVEIIDQLVRKYVKQGITKASEIIKKIQAKIIELATDFKCEDALSKQICDKIHEVADFVGVKYAKVIAFMKDVIARGKTTAKAIIE